MQHSWSPKKILLRIPGAVTFSRGQDPLLP
jgi:hypothetical protein